jgi:hypothetical protein
MSATTIVNSSNRVKDKPEADAIADDDWTLLDGETHTPA